VGNKLSYSDVLAAYVAEEPFYKWLVDIAIEKLEPALKTAVLTATVKGRAKTPESFATKAILKGYARPLEQIGDKAGVRVTTIYERDLPRIEGIVRRLFHVISTESKLDALAYNEFGYLGIHCDCRLFDTEAKGSLADLAGRRVEIQIRTMAQSAWAEVSHEQLYKPAADVPDELKRQIHRLVALVELFDSEVERFRAEAAGTPGFREAEALAPLSKRMLEEFGLSRRSDRQLSLLMAAALVPLYGDIAPSKLYDDVLKPWVDDHDEALRVQFEEAQALSSNPLYFQPEVFMIFERLDNDQARLRNSWPELVPSAWLNQLAEAWGHGG
jgi:ppGpp synthetase/RelA/SpoT-type nucleotidyltranferase